MTIGQLNGGWRKHVNARQQHEIKAASDMSIKDTLKAQRSSYLDEGEDQPQLGLTETIGR